MLLTLTFYFNTEPSDFSEVELDEESEEIDEEVEEATPKKKSKKTSTNQKKTLNSGNCKGQKSGTKKRQSTQSS